MGFNLELGLAIDQAYSDFHEYENKNPSNEEIRDYVVDWMCERFDMTEESADKYFWDYFKWLTSSRID